MPLEPLVLDDLAWADFVAASLRRIPAASGGRWTLHAPVDPGVTLLELYAWLFDQRVYWMDQVPESLTRALLTLLGVAPRPARVAATVLQVSPLVRTELPKGARVLPSKGTTSPIFTTTEDVTLFPLAKASPSPTVGLTVGGINRSADLAEGRAPRLLADGSHTKITLHIDPQALTGSTAGTFALFMQLKTAAGLTSQWLSEANASPSTLDAASPQGSKPPDYAASRVPSSGQSGKAAVPAEGAIPGPAPLTWSYSTRNGPVPLSVVDDGTLGLRRSGLVLLTMPEDWVPDPGGDGGYAIYLRSAQSERTYPPRLVRLVPNAVTIVNRYQVTLDRGYVHDQAASWRRLPGNTLLLPEANRPPLAETVAVDIQERDDKEPQRNQRQHWTPVPDLGPYGPDDRVFVVDAASGRLRFGDGLTGRLPVPVGKWAASDSVGGKAVAPAPASQPSDPVSVSYSVGGGRAGNLGGNLAWEFIDPKFSGLSARNVVPAEGGEDAETTAETRDRAASVLKEVGRAVTRDDFETIARTTPGAAIARAHAAISRHPAYPNRVVPGAVTIFIVPDLPRDSQKRPDPGLDQAFPPAPMPESPVRDAVQARLDAARLVTSEVYVRPPIYCPVTLEATVQTETSDLSALRESLNDALRAYLDPLTGGDDQNGWPFGGPIRTSSLLRIAQAALGDDGKAVKVTVTVLLKDTNDSADPCNDVTFDPDALVALQGVTVHFQRPPAGRGGLR